MGPQSNITGTIEEAKTQTHNKERTPSEDTQEIYNATPDEEVRVMLPQGKDWQHQGLPATTEMATGF